MEPGRLSGIGSAERRRVWRSEERREQATRAGLFGALFSASLMLRAEVS
jgi:hypothetical protein